MQPDDIRVLHRHEHSLRRYVAVGFDELDACCVAISEQTAPTPAVAGWPLMGHRPSEQFAVEIAGGVEGGGEPDYSQLHEPRVRSRAMKVLRRFLVALSLAGTIAGILRMRGKGGVPPQEGGWREVSVPPK